MAARKKSKRAVAAPALNGWLEKLKAEIQPVLDSAPPGFLTAAELANELGLSPRRTLDLISRRIKSGELKRIYVRTQIGKMPYYGPA